VRGVWEPGFWPVVVLVLWLGLLDRDSVKGIADLLHYVDDAFSASFSPVLSFYAPYNRDMPASQAKFLQLLDLIGVPHEDSKQQHGVVLEIIGFEVDISTMTIWMSDDAKANLATAIHNFINNPPNPRQQTLRSWLRILGYANWALNVFPLLKPGLNSSYNKVARRKFMNALIYVNKQTRNDLLWFAEQVESLEGIWVLNTEEWGANEVDFQIWGDASPVGLAFFSPTHKMAYVADPVVDQERTFNIFFNEAVTVLAALEWAASLNAPPKHLAIHTNSTTSFAIFNTLRALEVYNPIIMAAVKIRLESNIDLRIFHIEGKKNVVANALSRCAFAVARLYMPDLSIRQFMPPLDMSGAAKV
jgi:hypothetical protein